MNKFFIILLFLSLTNAVFSQKLSEEQKIILKIDRRIDYSSVVDFLQKCSKQINDGKKFKAIHYSSFATTVKIWLKYRWLVADTGLKRKWLSKVSELLVYMSKTQSYIESAKFNKTTQSDEYEKALKYMETAKKNLAALVEKPEKMPVGIIRKARQQKSDWQRSMRKKYNIK